MHENRVILTFDDAVSSHRRFVVPLLMELGFKATFFVCEFPPDFETNKVQYMTWDEIKELDGLGFEVANHTLTHAGLNGMKPKDFEKQLLALEARFQHYCIPKSESFAYPGGQGAAYAPPILKKHGFKVARAIGDAAWNVSNDNRWFVPSIPVHGPDESVFRRALGFAKPGEIPVLVYHGVPDYIHPWVDTQPDVFEREMRYLAAEGYVVLALRDITPDP